MPVGLLGNPSFRNLWAAGLLSATGSEISRLGLILYFVDVRNSVFDVALLVALKTLPGALAAPATGVLVDRFSKRTMMIASDLARMAFVAAILIRPSASTIYVMAALDSVATAIFEPARSSAIPLVVGRSGVQQANGIQESTANLTMIVGPIIGAELFFAAGLAAVLIVDALSYLVSALLVARMTISERRQRTLARSIVAEMSEGWRYCVDNKLVLHLTALLFVSMLCGGIWLPLAPFFIRDFLGGSERVLGWQFGAFGVGGVVGGLLVPRLFEWVKSGLLLVLALLAEAGQFIIYAVVQDVGASILILFCWGMTVSVVAVASYSILQLTVNEQFLGRVFSMVKQSQSLAMLVAVALAVVLSDRFSSHLIFLSAGLCYFWLVVVLSLTKGGRMLLVSR